MDFEDKKKKAVWRLGVLGPLVSARLEHGDRRALFEEAAARIYEDPLGRPTRVTARTVEEWYYRYLQDGLAALEPRERSDAGKTRVIDPEIAELILAAKREKPRRSIRRVIRMLERAKKVRPGELKKSTVHRLLQAHDLSARPRLEARERRAFRHAKAGDLWMGDVMHGPVVLAPDQRPRKSYLHAFLDSATRLVPACAFRLGETAADHQAVLKQAVLKHGLPRGLYLDRGAAQTAGSLKILCAELGIHLLHCRPYDPQAKGGVERFFRTFREEVVDELPAGTLELAELNSLTWSWLSSEYHQRIHGGTQQAPLQHWLSQVESLRPLPRLSELEEIFLHRARRRVRRDGTVRFEGRLLEVRSELSGRQVELRFDPQRPEKRPVVYVDGKLYCDTVELDVVRNSRRRRRKTPSATEGSAAAPSTGLDPLGLIQAEQERRSRPPRKRNDDDQE
jgi:transposase InsO family protein